MKTIETKFGTVMVDDDIYDKLQKEDKSLTFLRNIVQVRTKKVTNAKSLANYIFQKRVSFYTFKDGNRLNYTRENIILGRNNVKYSYKKYKGVSKNKSGTYNASTTNKNGEFVHIGTYKDEITAAIAYNKAVNLIYGLDVYQLNKLDISESLYNEIYRIVVVNIKNRGSRHIQGRNVKLKGCSSEYTGVSWAKDRNKWRGRMIYRGVQLNLGNYTKEIEAAQAYNEAALYLYGSDAKINPVPKPLHPVINLNKIKERLEKKGIEID